MIAVVLIGLFVAAGLSNPDEEKTENASAADSDAKGDDKRQTAPARKSEPKTTSTTEPRAKLEIQDSWTVEDAESIVITGVTEPGAEVVAREGSRELAATTASATGEFSLQLTGLSEGDTDVTVVSTVADMKRGKAEIVVTRTVSEAAYKASAQAVGYDELVKDPDALAGTVVHFKAQVFQFDTNTGPNSMLVSVTNQGYGFWSDNVLVSFLDTSIADNIDNEDVIEFWGEVVGAESYETAIGGSNTVPSVLARYMTLIKKE